MNRRNPLARLSIVLAGAALAVALVASAADSPTSSNSAKNGKGNAGWEWMKSLQGDWEGSYEGKVAARASYRLVSSGTALMETLVSSDHSDMITMYTADGDRLMMTHYCSVNNQPRMRAPAAAGGAKRLVFDYVDATNLEAPDAMHMHRLVVTLNDPDHFSQQWTSREKGKDTSSTFSFTRKK
ncbi:MAG: hypothetical protein M3R62_05945 [Acidobacteriota bacterium]|nr:hypothetical protein [Acidobacteriota bacterium]